MSGKVAAPGGILITAASGIRSWIRSAGQRGTARRTHVATLAAGGRGRLHSGDMIPTSVPHAPLGALASFNFGPPGAPAGFALPPDQPTGQNVFVGCRPSEADPWNLLPFFTATPGGPPPLPKGRFGRFFAAAGDKWMIGPLVFKLCTPYSFEPEPEDRFHYAPIVCGYLEYDNTHSGSAAELVFGIGAPGRRLTSAGLQGFASAEACGWATPLSPEVELRSDRAVFGADAGVLSALHFSVPPHAKRVYPLVLGFYRPGFYYTRHFADLTAVLAYGVGAHARYLALADERDAEFVRSPAPFDAKTRAATEIRAWLSQTRRLAAEPPLSLEPLRAITQAITG